MKSDFNNNKRLQNIINSYKRVFEQVEDDSTMTIKENGKDVVIRESDYQPFNHVTAYENDEGETYFVGTEEQFDEECIEYISQEKEIIPAKYVFAIIFDYPYGSDAAEKFQEFILSLDNEEAIEICEKGLRRHGGWKTVIDDLKHEGADYSEILGIDYAEEIDFISASNTYIIKGEK